MIFSLEKDDRSFDTYLAPALLAILEAAKHCVWRSLEDSLLKWSAASLSMSG